MIKKAQLRTIFVWLILAMVLLVIILLSLSYIYTGSIIPKFKFIPDAPNTTLKDSSQVLVYKIEYNTVEYYDGANFIPFGEDGKYTIKRTFSFSD